MDSKLKKIKIKSKKIGFFRFGKINDKYLLTNDFGYHAILTSTQFENFLIDNLNGQTYEMLKKKGFFKNSSSYGKEELINVCKKRNSALFNQGPSLHIIAVTLRCNFNCIYCQASSKPLKEKKYDMSLDTAKKTVDFIFNTPNPSINIEFQGGEPLTNWPTVRFIIEYARKKEKNGDKKVSLFLVSNLTLMTKKRLDFLIENNVNICTSLDGPEDLHNRNRPWVGDNSYKGTVGWIKKIQKRGKRVGALLTVTKEALKYPKKIIDEYLKLGFNSVHLRCLSYLGLAGKSKNEIGYSAEEFIEFWKKSMDYIISINEKGKFFQERETSIMLQKIITHKDSGYTDLRSPCGAVLGQILYNHNGKIYTCDEGRMLDQDDNFLVGTIDSDYKDIVLSKKTKTMIVASCLENTTCDRCVYKPYCGICPVKNYVYYGTLFPQIEKTEHCKIKKEQFKYIFSKMQDKKIRPIFDKWVK